MSAEVVCAANGWTLREWFSARDFIYIRSNGNPVYSGADDTAPVTTSVDAALALIEKRLPDRLVENFGEMRDSGPLTGHWLAQLGPRGPRRRLVGPITGANLQATLDAEVLCSAETGPLALCIALLKALQAQTDAALKPEGGET